MTNSLKEKLRRDEVVVVVNPDHPSPSLTEFVASLGFDGVFIDCEHGMATVERVQEMCRAARAAGVQSIVRPEWNAPHLLTRYLDAGADGLMVPHVETAASAKQIVETVRYARPKDFGDKLLIAMVESVAAIDNIPELLAVDGIDVLFVGPSDLSSSMGFAGQAHHPDVKAMVKRAIGEIRAGGKQAGTLVIAATAAEFAEAALRAALAGLGRVLINIHQLTTVLRHRTGR